MLQKINHWTTKAFVFVMASTTSLLAQAQSDGFVGAKDHVKEQGMGVVGIGLILAMVAGVVMFIYGAFSLKKLTKPNLQDGEKATIFTCLGVGLLLMIIPGAIAFGMGVFGSSETSDAVGSVEDWGL